MNLIEEAHIGSDSLATLLRDAYFSFNLMDEGSFYVFDGIEFPCWLKVHDTNMLIEIHSYVEFDELDEGSVVKAALHCNEHVLLPTFWPRGQRLHANYHLPYADG